jgi:hypothetical protein
MSKRLLLLIVMLLSLVGCSNKQYAAGDPPPPFLAGPFEFNRWEMAQPAYRNVRGYQVQNIDGAEVLVPVNVPVRVR